MMIRASRVLAALVLVGATVAANAQIARDIDTPSAGEIRGHAGNGNGDVMVYLGIPYAAPPVGENRWRAPQAFVPSRRGFDADSFGNRCQQAQQIVLFGSIGSSRGPGGGAPEPVSEDCLTLNVWSGAETDDASLPVMVWIHGNELTRGAASEPRFDGEALAGRGVIVVSFNYRLGTFGFLAHPALTAEAGSSGNYGLMDAVAALRWVRDNIAAFGGDPDKLTVFSGSAGATMTAALIGSPEAAGLFDQAILQSGGWMGTGIARMQSLAEAEEVGAAGLARFGDASLAELRRLPAGQLTNALTDPEIIVDGQLIPRDLSAIFAAGEQNPVAVIVGSNREEGIELYSRREALKPDEYEAALRARLGDTLADDFLSLYPAATNAMLVQSSVTALGHEMAWQMRLLANRQVEIGENAYVYVFTRVPPGTGEATAVDHGVEIPYVFNNMDESEGWTAGDRGLARYIASYWINFAETGDPNGVDRWDDVPLPGWPIYMGSEEFQTMELGDRIGTNPTWRLEPESAAIFDGIYAELVPAGSR
jgi:para-nitrobenzyl esterase